MIQIQKVKFDGLEIEITRRCNKRCDHCCKGDAQEITVTKEVIDKIFENVEDCASIAIVGGETTLALDMLSYLIDKIELSDWHIATLQITTNGKILDRRLIDIFGRFCDSALGRKVYIRISSDMFHDRTEYEPALKFYSETAKQVSRNIIVMLSGGIDSLKYEGRARQYLDEHPEYVSMLTLATRYPEANRRIKIEGNYVPCLLSISALGDLGVDNDASYERFDKCAFGNILEYSMFDLIHKNNSRCYLTCLEYEAFTRANSWKTFTIEAVDAALAYRAYLEIIKRIIFIRQWAREQYSYVPMQDIIEQIPFPYIVDPKDEEHLHQFMDAMKDIITQVYIRSEYRPPKTTNKLFQAIDDKLDLEWQNKYTVEHIDEETRRIYDEMIKNEPDEDERNYCMMLLFVIALLTEANNHDPTYPCVFLPPDFMGDKWSLLSSKAFNELEKLDQMCAYGTRSRDNGKNFPCDSDEDTNE